MRFLLNGQASRVKPQHGYVDIEIQIQCHSKQFNKQIQFRSELTLLFIQLIQKHPRQ